MDTIDTMEEFVSFLDVQGQGCTEATFTIEVVRVYLCTAVAVAAVSNYC